MGEYTLDGMKVKIVRSYKRQADGHIFTFEIRDFDAHTVVGYMEKLHLDRYELFWGGNRVGEFDNDGIESELKGNRGVSDIEWIIGGL